MQNVINNNLQPAIEKNSRFLTRCCTRELQFMMKLYRLAFVETERRLVRRKHCAIMVKIHQYKTSNCWFKLTQKPKSVKIRRPHNLETDGVLHIFFWFLDAISLTFYWRFCKRSVLNLHYVISSNDSLRAKKRRQRMNAWVGQSFF